MKILTTQEDAGERQKLRNVNQAFIQQKEEMHNRAMVSHERDCGIFDCPALNGTTLFCFKPTPDRIVE